MKKVLNKYSVVRNNTVWLNDIADYNGALDVVNTILEGLRYTPEEVMLTITGEYTGDQNNELKLLRFIRGYWFKPNRFGIQIRVTRTNEVIELEERLDIIDNKLLEPTRSFNGKSLRLNTIEPKSKFKLGAFHDPDTWFALSVWRNKGFSTLGKDKPKRDRMNATEVFSKLSQQPHHGTYVKTYGVDDEIRKLIKAGIATNDIRRQVRSHYHGTANELRQLIGQLKSE